MLVLFKPKQLSSALKKSISVSQPSKSGPIQVFPPYQAKSEAKSGPIQVLPPYQAKSKAARHRRAIMAWRMKTKGSKTVQIFSRSFGTPDLLANAIMAWRMETIGSNNVQIFSRSFRSNIVPGFYRGLSTWCEEFFARFSIPSDPNVFQKMSAFVKKIGLSLHTRKELDDLRSCRGESHFIDRKFMTIEDFTQWYEKGTKKQRSQILKFMYSMRKKVFIIHDVPGTLLRNPVITLNPQEIPSNWCRVNVDGSYNDKPRGKTLAGCGAVVRDEFGYLFEDESANLSYTYEPLPHATSSYEAKLFGVYYGLVKCTDMSLSKIILESDCKEIVNILRNVESPPSGESHIYKVLFTILSTFEDYRVVFQYREGNKVADKLANIAGLTSVQQGPPENLTRGQIGYLAHLDRVVPYVFRINQDDAKLDQLIASHV